MLLVNNQFESIDMYQYKLILATACSRYSLEEEFEYLIMTSYDDLEKDYYIRKHNKPKSPMDVFEFYLKEVRNIAETDDIIHSTYVKLFTLNVNEILPNLFESQLMEQKILHMLKIEIKRYISDSDWQVLRGFVLDALEDSIKLNSRFYGKYSNLFGIIKTTIGFYHKKEKKNIHELLNKTGTGKLSENDLDISTLNIETLPVSNEVFIDFPEVIRSINVLNEDLFLHRTENLCPFYFYDLLTFYKRIYLEQIKTDIEKIFFERFKVRASSFVVVDEPIVLKNSGVAEKLRKHNLMLKELQPIVEFGLKPEDVNDYVRKIYIHVVNTYSGNASGLFTIKQAEKIGNYNTQTTFSKLSGHEKIKHVLEGLVALNHLFVYISAKKINLFDIASEVFMDKRYLYRFKTIDEVLNFLPTIKELMMREEDKIKAIVWDENKLPFNDDLINLIEGFGNDDFSIPAVSITPYLGSVTELNKSRKRNQIGRETVIYNGFYNALEKLKFSKRRLESISIPIQFGKTNIFVPFVPFALSIANEKDIITALNVDVFNQAGIKAEAACVRTDTGYYSTPKQSLEHYCYHSKAVVEALGSLYSQTTSEQNTVLELYRNCSFFSSMWKMLEEVCVDLERHCLDLSPFNGVKMGFFDAYRFTSEHLFVCTLHTLKTNEAVKKITNIMGTNLFITEKISLNTIYVQLERMYSFVLSIYKEAFLVLENLSDIYYFEFANKIGGGYSLTGSEAFLKGARQAIIGEGLISMSENFRNFGLGCSRTIDGYLKSNGKLVTKLKKGKLMVLHERGCWVGLLDDGHYFINAVADDEFP